MWLFVLLGKLSPWLSFPILGGILYLGYKVYTYEEPEKAVPTEDSKEKVLDQTNQDE